MLTPATRFHAERPVRFTEPKQRVVSEGGVEVRRTVAPRRTITINRHPYSVGVSFAGKIATAQIETTVVHLYVGGKLIKTIPRRHLGEVTRFVPDKKHRSRRAADARRRALTDQTDEDGAASAVPK